MRKDFLYTEMSNNIAKLIRNGVLKLENCMRLSLGLSWSEEIRRKMKLLGQLAALEKSNS
jgi:DNA-binding transcriptional MocR family regulator